MQIELAEILKDLPWALVFVYFLHETFKQRRFTQEMMAANIEKFIEVLRECCDDDGETV